MNPSMSYDLAKAKPLAGGKNFGRTSHNDFSGKARIK
jgi:hypothetical protein